MIIGLEETLQMLDAVEKSTRKLPEKIGTLAVNFSKERFVEQSWKDAGKETWKKRKPSNQRRGKRANGAILVSSGRLKRSIRKIKVGSDYVIIGTDVEYAQVHNEGGKISGTFAVKAHPRKAHTRKRNGRREAVKEHNVSSHVRIVNFTMPKRQFLGESATLIKRIELLIHAEYNRAFKLKK